jgi:RNA polymerase sigma-70 factor (ECF subfamily)
LVLTGSAREEVEDLIQQGFVKLIQTLNEGIPVAQPKSWLLRVLHNIRIDDYRKRKREVALEDLQPMDALERLFAIEPDPEAGLLHQEQFLRFQACLRRLTPKQCHYLVLRVEGLKLREIAEMFGVTVQTVSETCAKALLEFGELRDEQR